MKTIKDFVEFLTDPKRSLEERWRVVAQDGEVRILWKDGENPVILELPDETELTSVLWTKLVRKFNLKLD